MINFSYLLLCGEMKGDNFKVSHANGVFTLADTETATETDKKMAFHELCGIVHTVQTRRPMQISVGLVSVSVSVSVSDSVNEP